MIVSWHHISTENAMTGSAPCAWHNKTKYVDLPTSVLAHLSYLQIVVVEIAHGPMHACVMSLISYLIVST
ncbi:hypothetical protein BDA96_08G121000 [Sorghum bicolor]|uniref:Uncharacterized protein n=1 Tax=Sorghum bicolor TaxID=4558 RepID=A0A921QFT4_SORBI|nr:hypothetical protein BDA96_08G121000 [Sorghum bicolor]